MRRGVIALALLFVFGGACTDEDATVDALRAAGYTKVSTTGFSKACTIRIETVR